MLEVVDHFIQDKGLLNVERLTVSQDQRRMGQYADPGQVVKLHLVAKALGDGIGSVGW